MFARCQPVWCLALLLFAGCMTLSAKHEAQKANAPEFAGKVYLFRGIGGVFSLGIDAMAKQLDSVGLAHEVNHHPLWWSMADRVAKERASLSGPLVLVGHSYGADAAMRLAHKLDERNVTVDLLVTLEPVTPPRVPKNVKHVVNIYLDKGALDAVPFWRGVPLAKDADAVHVQLENIHVQEHPDLNFVGLTHANIDDNPIIQQEVLRHILRTCKQAQ